MATSCRSAKLSRSTRSREAGQNRAAQAARAPVAHFRAVDNGKAEDALRSGGSPSVRFSATDRAGTSRSSCGMVMTPAAMASRGPLKCRTSPPTAISPRSGRCTPPRMRTSVDFPAPFSPTSACTSPGSTSNATPSSARVAPNCLLMSRALAAGRVMPVTVRNLTGGARDAHLLVGEPAALDDHVVVQRDGAVAHRHVIVAFGGALAAALGIRAGGEQEIAGKTARAGMMAHRGPGHGARAHPTVPAD